MMIKTICVLGGTGFVGSHLLTRLNTQGIFTKVLTRHRERHRHLLVLPNVQLIEADVHRSDILDAAFHGVDAVINLIGILNEPGHSGEGFRQAHVELARKILDACHKNHTRRLLQMSALNADAANGASFYLRSKGEAENHLHTFCGNQLHVTSFRPSVIFGPGDSFFTRFATLLRYTPWLFPVARGQAKFAPVYVGDVVDSMVQTLTDNISRAKRIELCGPEIYSLQELLAFTAACLKIKRKILSLPDSLGFLQALFLEYLVPGKLFSLDNFKSLKIDSVCRQLQTTRTSIKTIVPTYLRGT